MTLIAWVLIVSAVLTISLCVSVIIGHFIAQQYSEPKSDLLP